MVPLSLSANASGCAAVLLGDVIMKFTLSYPPETSCFLYHVTSPVLRLGPVLCNCAAAIVISKRRLHISRFTNNGNGNSCFARAASACLLRVYGVAPVVGVGSAALCMPLRDLPAVIFPSSGAPLMPSSIVSLVVTLIMSRRLVPMTRLPVRGSGILA